MIYDYVTIGYCCAAVYRRIIRLPLDVLESPWCRKRMAFFILGFLAVAVPAGETAGIVISTDRAEEWRLGDAVNRGQTFSAIDYSPENGRLLQVKMVPARFFYLELVRLKPITVARSGDELPERFSLELFVEPANALLAVSVRIQDSSGEVFQYKQHIRSRSGTWRTIEIPLKTPCNVWGGNQDKIIDFPVRFLGLAVECNKLETQECKLLFGKLLYHPGRKEEKK